MAFASALKSALIWGMRGWKEDMCVCYSPFNLHVGARDA